MLITSKARIWELLINYFKQHYGNERTAAGNLKRPLLPIVIQWVKKAWDEQHDKSDSDEEGDDMYDDMMSYEQIQHMSDEDIDDDEFWSF